MFDTDIFAQEWFGELNPVQKLTYIYLLMSCDCAGVIEINMRRFKFDLGADIARDDIFHWFGNRIVPIGDAYSPTKALIPDFIPFHYGKHLINDRKHPIHKAVVRRIKSVGLTLEEVCRLSTKKFDFDNFDNVSPNEGSVQTELRLQMPDAVAASEKNMGVESDTKEKRKSAEKTGVDAPYYNPTLDDVKAYFAEVKTSIDPEEFWAKYDSVGWVDKNKNKIKFWKRCLVTWERFRKRNGSSSTPRGRGDNWRGGSATMNEEANRAL